MHDVVAGVERRCGSVFRCVAVLMPRAPPRRIAVARDARTRSSRSSSGPRIPPRARSGLPLNASDPSRSAATTTTAKSAARSAHPVPRATKNHGSGASVLASEPRPETIGGERHGQKPQHAPRGGAPASAAVSRPCGERARPDARSLRVKTGSRLRRSCTARRKTAPDEVDHPDDRAQDRSDEEQPGLGSESSIEPTSPEHADQKGCHKLEPDSDEPQRR